MKKILIFLAILPNLVMAQATLTQAQLDEFAQKLRANPVETVKKYTHKDFTFINGYGFRFGYNELVGNYTYSKEITRNLTDVKIVQINQTASVTGKIEHEWQAINNPTKISKYTGMFTYIYVYDAGLWKIISAQHTDYQPSIEVDEAAIKKVIQDETDGYYEGNAEKNINQWSGKASDEYQRQMFTSYIGNTYAKGESMVKLKEIMRKNVKKQEANITNTDYEIRRKGNMAWVTYTQEVKQGEKILQKARETRILERINGDWKIVFVSGQDVK